VAPHRLGARTASRPQCRLKQFVQADAELASVSLTPSSDAPVKRIEFITIEDERDLIVSFALAPSAYRSLTLLRSPQYEWLLPEHERGISVSFDPGDPERDLLRWVQWHESSVTVKSQRHEYHLDVSAVAEDEVSQAKALLRKMVADGPARMIEGG
jgi:hypothetical protein